MPNPSELQREEDDRQAALKAIHERVGLRNEISTLRMTLEKQARTIVALQAELTLIREQRLMDERKWMDDMAGQKPKLCPTCGREHPGD